MGYKRLIGYVEWWMASYTSMAIEVYAEVSTKAPPNAQDILWIKENVIWP